MSESFWDMIPHGKTDPPMLLWDASKPMSYDFNDPDSQYVMFNRGLEGCFALPFSKPMEMTPGICRINGQELPCTIQTLNLGGFQTWWMGAKIGGALYEYGQSADLEISGFRDTDGNTMLPATIRLETAPKAEPLPAYASHEQIALQAAQDGIVLLKNENQCLPLPEGTTLNFFGKGTYEFRICAVGAGKVFPRYVVGLAEAARRDTSVKVNRELLDFYACGKDILPDPAVLASAKAASDCAFMVISRPSGENTDNSSAPGEFYLTQDEEKLLKDLRENFAKLVVILNVGYPISTAFAETCHVDALLYTGFGGMLAGQAIMDVLTGRINPSGKLPDTWSERYDSIPAAKNFYDCAGGKKRIVTDDGEIWLNTAYEEDLYVGYRYFETFPEADRRGFPFGYGLSYTNFAISCKECRYDSSALTAVVCIKNIGSRAGREVAQLYLSKPQGVLEQPARELIAFEKTRLLAPGEAQKITFTVPDSHMTSYNDGKAAYVMQAGVYRVFLGGDVRTAQAAGQFALDAEKIIKKVKNRMRLNMPLDTLSQADKGSYPKGLRSGIMEDVHTLQPARTDVEEFSHPVIEKTNRKLTFRDVLADNSLLTEFVGNLTVRQLARICVCASDGWGVEGRGEAGRLARPEGLELPEMVVADGNSGVNLRTRNIGMPSGATLCASFDKALMEQVGKVIGEEARELGIQLILAPALNLHRDPLNGRQPEYFSEDPYLAGTMAGWYCKGLESTGTGGCYKHLIANNAESGRKRNQSILTERAIRELYFRAFSYAMEVHTPVSVMTAYNGVNGLFTSCDPELIQGLLYEESGFKGFVMTDWTSYDSADVVQMAIAGNAWITPGSEDDTYTSQLENAVTDGRLPLGQLQDNARRIITALLQLESWKNA